MTRISPMPYENLPPDAGAVLKKYGTEYGPFNNQAQVLAHVPPTQHLAAMLMELKQRQGIT